MKSPELIDEAPNTLREDELRELGFEEDDEPTQMLVDPRPLSRKPTTIVPPRIDDGDVYMLTEQHLRYKAGIVPMDDERVDLRDIMRAPASLPPMSEPVPVADAAPAAMLVPRANSLSPVAMSNGDSTAPPAVSAIQSRPHPAWPATLAVLAVAAVGVFFIRPSTPASASSAAAPELPAVAMAVVEEKPAVAATTGAFELPAIEIQAAASPAQVALPINAQVAAVSQSPAATEPMEAPVAAPVATAAAEELPPVEPPPAELPPFDRSVAASALNAAAGSASSCREPGVPSSPVSVRVTFAPSGSVTIAVVENAPYAGTAAGGCIARAFRSARVAAFSGTPVTVHKTFQID